MILPKSVNRNRILFWMIIVFAVGIVVMLSTVSTVYQTLNKQVQATRIAIPTVTAEALEAIYQKGLAYINIGHWSDAKRELDIVFEINPNYREVQAKLIEVQTKLTELNIASDSQGNTLSPVVATQEDSIDLNKGLITYYPFNGNARDESEYGHQGNVFGATLTEDRFGNPISAYDFDGIDDYIEIPHGADLNPTNTISLAAWIFVRQLEYYPAVISKGNVGSYQESYSLFLNPDNQLGFLLNRDSTSRGRTLLVGTVIPLNTWMHIVSTYDGITMYSYINGVQVGQTTHRGGIFTTSDPVLIGKSERQSSNYQTSFFNGSIDEVKIFNRFLSPEEVQTIFKESSVDK